MGWLDAVVALAVGEARKRGAAVVEPEQGPGHRCALSWE